MPQPAKAAAALAVAVAAVLLFAAAHPALALTKSGGVELEAAVDGTPIASSTESRPIRLSPRRQATLSVKVTNNTAKAVDIRIVRLEGKVVGLTFFAYDTAVGLEMAPGETGFRRFVLDLAGLEGQATGLIPGAVKVLDVDRQVVAEQSGVIDVRGSLLSVYGIFGMTVAFLTVLTFVAALVGLARHRLSANRWRRALRFLTPGLGLGLLINFTLSATRVFVPTPGRWLTIVVVSAAVLFGLGYLTPAPDSGEDEEDDERAALPAAPVAPQIAAQPSRPKLPAHDEVPSLTKPPPSAASPTLDVPPVPPEAR